MAQDFIDLASGRFSERHFSPEPVEEDKLALIIEAGRVAPTAENAQPQRFLVIQSAEGLAKVDLCSRCRFGAPVVVVIAYDMTVAARNPDVADFGVVDSSIVATHLMLEAADLGVHSCWVGLVDPSELRRQFDIPREYRVLGILDLGYPGEKSRPSFLHRHSKETGELFFRETYGSDE